MKRILICAFLMMSFYSHSLATEIDLKASAEVHNGNKGGARTSLLPIVKADITDGIITYFISRFDGNVNVYVCDENRVIVTSSTYSIQGSGSNTIFLDCFNKGEYSLYIVLLMV